MRIALIDDEDAWRAIIYQKLQKYFTKADIRIFQSGSEFIQKQEMFDIVFLDIEMAGMDGFETAREYREYAPDSVVIILTTHSEMVKRGYLVNAFRYLDKVNLDEELSEAAVAVRKRFQKSRKITVPIVGLGKKIFELKDILYVETEKRNICIHTWNESFISSLEIGEIEEMMGENFFRCHRSYIVNLDMIKEVNRLDLFLKNGDTVLLSARKRADFKQRYLNWRYEYANA